MTKKELLETIKLKAIAVCAIRYANGRMDYYLQKSREINTAKDVWIILARFDMENNKLLRTLLDEDEKKELNKGSYWKSMELVA